jgi:hypothetical protein
LPIQALVGHGKWATRPLFTQIQSQRKRPAAGCLLSPDLLPQ